MRIALDYTTAIGQGAGVGRYVRCLVDALLAQDSYNQYLLLSCERPTTTRAFPSATNVRGRSIFLPDRYWFRWQLPFYSRYFSGPIDIYHGPNFALPALKRRIRKIVTIHDLAYLEYPQFAAPETVALLNKVVPIALENADVISTVSHEACRTLVEYYKVPQEKFVVVPNGVGAAFRRVTDPVLLEITRRKFGLEHPFILAVGTQEPRKNHVGLIKAFYEMQGGKHGPALLVFAGGRGWNYGETLRTVTDLGLEERVRFLGRVDDAELVTLYSLADVFAFPSFFEGFGIPPLEAMACGAPVITSNTSSLPEVVGDAALLVDPHDTAALAAAMIRLLEDEQLRAELRYKGYQRVQRYTWSEAASKMLSVYQRLHEGATDFSEEALSV